MQREIKFRVWSKKYNTFLDVDEYCLFSDSEKDCLKVAPLMMGGIKWEGEGEYNIQQYTGLKDKNGKEIYEGDIIHHEYGGTSIVKWISEVDRWDYTGWMIENTYNKGGFREVIGNIFENSELVELVN